MLFSSPAVTSFLLVNADTDQPIGTLIDGATVNFRRLGTSQINIVAQFPGPHESVRFDLDGQANVRTENDAPYSLAGSAAGGDFLPWTPSLGTHTLSASAFTADDAGGGEVGSLQVVFRVADALDPVMLHASVSSIAFGSVAVGAAAESLLTLTNPAPAGGASVTIHSTDITGSGVFTDDFDDGSAGVTLAPGQSLDIKTHFTPTADGPVAGTLTVGHSGTNSALAIGLAGSGGVNDPPVLAAIGSRTFPAGGTFAIPVSATDADADAIVLSAANLPAWATFTDFGDGTGRVLASPPAATSGTFTGVTVTAADGVISGLSDSESFDITVSDLAPAVVGLVLINADSNDAVGPLYDGTVIGLGDIGTNEISVRANASAATGSVRFALDGDSNFRTENSAPYTLAGDNNGNYQPWIPSLGNHTLTVTPYASDNTAGAAGTPVTVHFTVAEGTVIPNFVAAPESVSISAAQHGGTAATTVQLSASDGAVDAAYAATSNALWLTVTPAGTIEQPLALSVDTTALAPGTHEAKVTVKSPTHKTLVIPVTLTVTGAFVADQVHLSFVQDPSATMTVVWRTMKTSTPSLVEYRQLGDDAWLSVAGALRDSGTAGTLHETTLTGLAPATSYEYRVRGDDAAWSEVFTARTMPPLGPSDFDLVYFADTGLIGREDGLDTGTSQAIKEILALDVDLLLPGGDYAYYNTDERYGSLDNSIDAWFNQNQPIFSRTPVMPTYGNHEVLLGEGYGAWADRFATPQGWNGQQNYSFDVGEVHFVSIMAVSDSGGLSSGSVAWLESDLAAAQAAGRKWIIPYFHVSPFSDGTSHPTNLALRAQLGPLFEQYGVKVALASHDQSYERTHPLTGVPDNITPTSLDLTGYDATDGVTWIKVSPAGKLSNRNGVNNFSKFQTDPPPFWTASRDDTMHHFSRLAFSAAGTLRVETYGFSGDGTPAVIIDSFEYDLSAAAPPPETVPGEADRRSRRVHPRAAQPAELDWKRVSVDELGIVDGEGVTVL